MNKNTKICRILIINILKYYIYLKFKGILEISINNIR